MESRDVVSPTVETPPEPPVDKRKRVYVVTGEAPTSIAALTALLYDAKLVGMTRAQRQAQIPAPKREPGKREMARRLRRGDCAWAQRRDARREAERRAALLGPAFPKDLAVIS